MTTKFENLLGLLATAAAMVFIAALLFPDLSHAFASHDLGGGAVIAMAGLPALHHRPRGILSVRAEDENAIFRQLQRTVEDFKASHNKRLSNVEKHLDQVRSLNAALEIGSATEGHGSNRAVNAAVTQFLRTGDASAMSDFLPQNVMRTDSAPDGGFTVPTEIDNMIQNQLVAISPMRAACGGGRLVGTSDYHKLINKRGATTGWAGERDPRTETETPQLADIVPPMGELWAYPSVTQWAVDDSQFDLAAFVQENVTDEMALQEGASFISGDGMKKPLGLLSIPNSAADDEARPFGTLQYIVSGGASDFAASNPGDALIDLVHSVKAVYRAGPNVGWQMNSATAGKVRKFKDGQGNYLWQEAISAGQPSLLCGYPVWENEDMPDVGANALPIAFGNWARGYLIVDRTGVKVLRDPYTKPGWLRFYISRRVGGCPSDTRAIKLLKIST